MYIDLPADPLVVEVSDRLINDTLFKQKATFANVAIGRDVSNETSVSLDFRVDLFASNGGKYGDRLTGFGVGSYLVNVRADNSCGVYFDPQNIGHPRTGEIISNRGILSELEWIEQMNAMEEPVVKQGRLYALLMKYPQAMEALIIAECHRANGFPFNKFGATPPVA